MSALDEFIQTEYVEKQIEKSGDTHFTCVVAEESILRRMLKSHNVANDVAETLSGKDFSNVDYGRLFCAIQDVLRADRHVDAITVEDAIGRLFPRNAKRLRDLVVVLTKYREPTVDDAHNIAEHIEIVKSLARRRNASKQLDELMRQLQNPSKNINETLLEIRDAVDNSDDDGGDSVSLQEVLLRTWDYMEKRQKGEIKAIKSGLDNLDKLIGGFYGGELTVIAARPSVGKSAFAQFISLKAVNDGYRVGFVSCEMTDVGLGQRVMAYLSGVDGMKIRQGELNDADWGKCSDALAVTGDLRIDYKFDTIFIEDIVQWAKRKVRHGEMDMLVVDYLQLMETRKRFDAEHLRVGYISKSLKRLATQLNIPVIALAQVNRETDGSMPTLKHLKDSGSIEQDCDGVIFLHKPKDANDATLDDRGKMMIDELAEKGFRYMCIGVAKQRQGQIGVVSAIYDPATTMFTKPYRD